MPVKEATDRWTDWRWQQRAAIRTAADLREILPGLADADVTRIDAHSRSMRFQLTPHYVGLIERTADGQAPAPDDPLWHQVSAANPDGPATAAVTMTAPRTGRCPRRW